MSQISENEIHDKVKEFQRWIKTQPQLPQVVGKLIRILVKSLKLKYSFNTIR